MGRDLLLFLLVVFCPSAHVSSALPYRPLFSPFFFIRFAIRFWSVSIISFSIFICKCQVGGCRRVAVNKSSVVFPIFHPFLKLAILFAEQIRNELNHFRCETSDFRISNKKKRRKKVGAGVLTNGRVKELQKEIVMGNGTLWISEITRSTLGRYQTLAQDDGL